LLTGRPLYTGETPLDVLVRVLHEDPTPPHVYRPELPRDLETICLKCLAKNPAGRYASARDLAEDLRRFLVGEPIHARPPSLLYRSGKFVQRHKTLVGAVGGIVITLAAGIIATSLTALSEARQRRLADENARQAELARQDALFLAYQGRMAAALAALGDHNVGEAADQLAAVPEEQRGWEWHFAAARLDDSIAVFRDVGQGIVPYPASNQFVSISDQGIRLWDATSGQLRATLSPQAYSMIEVGTTSAGRLVLAADNEIGPLDMLGDDGRIRQRLTLPGKHFVHAWAFDPTGTRLACAWVGDSQVKGFALFDLTDGRQLAQFALADAEILSIAFTPDGRRLVTGGNDRLVRIWDPAGTCLNTFARHTGFVTQVAVSPDERRVLSCAADQAFRQWDISTGRLLDERYADVAQVNTAVYSPDGSWIVTGGTDGTIRYWLTSGGPAVAVLHGHTKPVMRLAFSPDGRRVYSVSAQIRPGVWEARVWDGPGHGNPRILRDHTNFVYPVAYSPDGRTIASGSWDNDIRLWDAASGETRRVLRGHEHYVAGVAFSPDSRYLVSRGADKTLRVWEVETGKPLAVLQHVSLGSAAAPHGVAITPDGSRIACAADDKLYFWELPGGREAGSMRLPSQSARVVQFSLDGNLLAMVDEGSDIHILDAKTGESRLLLRGHSARVNNVAFNRDGTRLVSASGDHTVRLWDVTSGECLRVLYGHTDEVFAAVFHPDGSRIASAGRDRVIRIWDPVRGAELARLPGHTSYVFSLAFSPDGDSLVSGSGDYSVRLWDTFPVARRLQARDLLAR
jgi:WD40 repeat protein